MASKGLRGARAGAALLLAVASAHAAAPDPAAVLTERDVYGEVPVVLTASRLRQPLLDTPAAVTVLDRELIRLSGAREVVELFRLVPGFVLITDNGNTQAVTLHGLADIYSRRFQVLVDGRSIYLPSLGGVAWSELGIALDDIERIEVIRGPNSAAYGSNAFLGVINIITRHASTAPRLRVAARAGMDRIRDGYLSAAGSTADAALDWRLTLGRESDMGFDDRPDRRDLRSLNLRLDWQQSLTDSWYVGLGGTAGVREDGRFGDPNDPPRDRDVRWAWQHLRWTRATADDELTAQVFHQRRRSRERYTAIYDKVGGVPITAIVDTDASYSSERLDAELQWTRTPRPGLRWALGAGARLDRVRSRRYFGRGDWLENHVQRLFGTFELDAAPRLTVHGGAMLERDGISGWKLAPRLAFNVHLAPWATLRLAASRAHRTPLLVEERAEARETAVTALGDVTVPLILASGGLTAERILSREAGLVVHRRHLTGNLRVFREDLSDVIYSPKRPVTVGTPLGPVSVKAYDFANAQSASVQGAELEVAWRRGPLLAHLAYAYTVIDGRGPDADELERSAPRHVGSLLAGWRLPRDWTLSGVYYYIGKFQALGFADEIGAVRRLDLRFARRLRRAGTRTELALVAQNLLDTYPETRQRPGKGPNFFDTRVFVEVRVER